jgi:murein DD-endopeptidase MepM/ murein hydrolase activator NlpD
MRPVHKRRSARALSRQFVIALVSLGVAGCSGEVTRFAESPFSSPFASRGALSEPTGSVASAPATRVERESLQAMPLPPPSPSMPVSYHPPHTAEMMAATPDRTGTRSNWATDGGTSVTLAPGETIEGLSRRYGVPSAAIMRANNITAPASIRPGQHLVIPRYSAAPTGGGLATRPPLTPARASAQRVSAGSGERAHIVAAGETLSLIARKYHRSRVALAKANNLEPDGKLRIGQKIIVPGTKAPLRVAAASAAEPSLSAPANAEATTTRPPNAPGLTTSQRSAAGPSGTAHLTSPSSEPEVQASTASTPTPPTGAAPNFRWPVHGKIVAGFGSKASGQQNDGINFAVPEGTPVKAADDGVVAYAGNELKGYGNLVLVRHANGFVTAYANASELMVKRGDQVRRGQVIAHSGQTGTVTAPQLHFEIRKGATPVDPTQYLSGT